MLWMCVEWKKKQEGPFFLSKCENKANKVGKNIEQFFILDMAPLELDSSYNYGRWQNVVGKGQNKLISRLESMPEP